MRLESKDSSVTAYMEAPCRCDCGTWFDLHDGYGSTRSSKVICSACHAIEERQDQFNDELYDYYSDDNFRALTWHQPFASMMLHGKIETRNKPTNVRGKVLICASQKPYLFTQLMSICGEARYRQMVDLLKPDPYWPDYGKAIAVADLVGCRLMTVDDEAKCFVTYRPGLWCWIFDNVQAIEPFPVKGKQGWRFVTKEMLDKITLNQNQ